MPSPDHAARLREIADHHSWIGCDESEVKAAALRAAADDYERLKRDAGALAERLLEMPQRPNDADPAFCYTDWCSGADGTGKQPYTRQRNRQCSIGYHDECTDPEGETCGCPCHDELVASYQTH